MKKIAITLYILGGLAFIGSVFSIINCIVGLAFFLLVITIFLVLCGFIIYY